MDIVPFNELLYPHSLLKMNASIAYHDEKIYCAYRTDDLREFNPKNYLTILDKNFAPISHRALTLDNGNTAFEDIRLFSFKGYLLALFTFLPISKSKKWKWQYTVGIGIVDIKNGQIIRQRSLRPYSTQMHEKNWVPFSYGDGLFLVTNWEPVFRVLKLTGSIEDFVFEEICNRHVSSQWGYGTIRGGTPLIKYTSNHKEWLYGFVHSSRTLIYNGKKGKFYYYTLVKLHPKTLEFRVFPLPLSIPKNGIDEDYLDQNYIEKYLMGTKGLFLKVVFPMGIIESINGIIISYGKDDCVSKLKFFSWDYVLALFGEPTSLKS